MTATTVQAGAPLLNATDSPVAPAASTAAVPSQPLAFRPDAEFGFPWAGAALLLVLILVALAARWPGLRAKLPLARWLGQAGTTMAPQAASAALSVHSTVRLNGQTQLHDVAWHGRRLLIATGPNAQVVLLDRDAAEHVTPT